MTTRKRSAAARGAPSEPLPWLDSYCFYSCQRPMHKGWSLVLFVRATAALQSWSGGHCAAKMATRLVVIHRFESLSLNAIYIAGILLLAAALFGLAVGGFSAGRASHPARPGQSGFPIRDKATRHFSLGTGVVAAVDAALRLGRRQEGWSGPFARHFVASLRPREPPASGATNVLAKHLRLR